MYCNIEISKYIIRDSNNIKIIDIINVLNLKYYNYKSRENIFIPLRFNKFYINNSITPFMQSSKNITHLFFSYFFNNIIGRLPPNLIYLRLGNYFYQPIGISALNISNCGETLYLKQFLSRFTGYLFDQIIDELPLTLTHLIFGDYFNQKVDNLPTNITHLTFGRDFNRKVDNLPQSITHLTFGNNFNQNVDNLPKNITHLKFGNSFNQCIDKLPLKITHLTLGYDFKQSLASLPKNLTHLSVGYDYYERINKLILPPNIIKFLINEETLMEEVD